MAVPRRHSLRIHRLRRLPLSGSQDGGGSATGRQSSEEPGEGFTTQDLQIKIFRPVSGPEIEIEAKVINRSKTTGYVEADWRLPNGKLAAKILSWKAIRPVETFKARE